MIIKPMTVRDLKAIDFNEVDEISQALGMTPVDLIAARFTVSMGYTLFTDTNEVVMIAGVTKMWGGFYETWILVTPLFKHYSKSAIRLVKQLLKQLAIIGFDRVQADIDINLPANIRFIEHFGFVEEGKMSNYGINKETFVRYALYGEN